jgi:hypothetical protein
MPLALEAGERHEGVVKRLLSTILEETANADFRRHRVSGLRRLNSLEPRMARRRVGARRARLVPCRPASYSGTK